MTQRTRRERGGALRITKRHKHFFKKEVITFHVLQHSEGRCSLCWSPNGRVNLSAQTNRDELMLSYLIQSASTVASRNRIYVNYVFNLLSSLIRSRSPSMYIWFLKPSGNEISQLFFLHVNLQKHYTVGGKGKFSQT